MSIFRYIIWNAYYYISITYLPWKWVDFCIHCWTERSDLHLFYHKKTTHSTWRHDDGEVICNVGWDGSWDHSVERNMRCDACKNWLDEWIPLLENFGTLFGTLVVSWGIIWVTIWVTISRSTQQLCTLAHDNPDLRKIRFICCTLSFILFK